MVRFFPMALCVLSILAFFSATEGLRAETDEQTVKAILRDWAARHDSMRTFHYVCALATVEKVVHGPTDPFGSPIHPGENVAEEALTKTMTFSYDNGKLAWREEGEQWSEGAQSKVPFLSHYVFNGKDNFERMQQAKYLEGRIDHRNKPDSALISAVDHWPIWVTFDPAGVFKRKGVEVEKMRIASRDVECDGFKCIEVVWANKRGVAHIFVDAARGHLPVKFVTEGNGKVGTDFHIKYKQQEDFGWVLSESFVRLYDSRGEKTTERDVVVQNCEINKKLNKKLFEIDFPVGTPITEQTPDGERYSVRDADGSMKSVSKDRFDAIRNAGAR
jgi:hypothetical protein